MSEEDVKMMEEVFCNCFLCKKNIEECNLVIEIELKFLIKEFKA